MSALVDTSFLEALHNKREEKHERAKEIVERIDRGEFGKLLLHEYVFDEAVTLALSHSGKADARALGEWLLSSEFELIPSDSLTFKEAWKLFNETESLSFTDCVITAVAKQRGAAVITFDKHFRAIPGLKTIS